jgi:hypothetical protein
VRTDDAHDTGTNNAKENAIEKAFSRIVKPRTWQECFCYRNPDREGYVDTALWVLLKSALLRLLPLDPALVRNHADELNLRLVRAGRADLAAPKITSWYSRRPSLSALFRPTASGRELGSERQC